MSIRHLSKILGLSIVLALAVSTDAYAAGIKVGATLDNITKSTSSVPQLLNACAYLLGLLFAIVGVFKFKDHVDNPANTPLSSGVKRFIAGGLLFAAPYTSHALKGSLAGTSNAAISYGARHGINGNGVDLMVINFIDDIAGPATFLIQAAAYIGAIIFLISGVVRLTKTAQEGPRGPAGLGTVMTFISAGALFSFSQMLAAFSSSLFGSPQLSTFANINIQGLDANAVNTVAPVIESVMIFIMIVGLIAFVRGWFVLKAFADGSREASVAQGLTFLIGGALAVNLGQVVNAVSNTLGINSITFN